MNSMPFSMLPLRPSVQTERSFFSCSVIPSRMLVAFSDPLVCMVVSFCCKWMTNDAYSERNRNREEVHTGGLGDGITAGDAGQIDESRLDNARLALEGLDDALREPITC